MLEYPSISYFLNISVLETSYFWLFEIGGQNQFGDKKRTTPQFP
ncbi:hypothetical protein [Enterococcus sp. AZ154]